ncbi:elongation of very long chain fatty acids protein AAEL008004-like [Chelonus insularis]|uniref:elongation of very long chain fatty acids protein AAEL008004-like n=1 Tax=Chelonus insularis TaxID=460826 RepID=UPI00158B056E|nr:elongation of very long chain fatty acids protein AAEL008004-like [Chelonus insularis]XP_034945985.1 elongation of very long chain fatty acids protein AAEL008004-like [Chelonus insularis]XP_034945986.1 elongation of very long chain fatty acids protein AAEL008004-like [Chelonus insularis]XP_034945987.1 elongation of very long chain fatty acids protein AAEL008004-like [Chelonus insularis]
MTNTFASIVHGYRDLMDNKSDPRVKDWPMMSSPLPTMVICVLYAYFSKVLGPRLMENRKPFNIRRILVVYNLIQTIFSAWIFYEYLMSGWAKGYSFRCQPVDYSQSPLALRMAQTCWWYYFSKFTEFFDTLFFILRKKYQQVSTLHVIHHGVMPFSVWMGLKFAPGGHSTFFALLNTFVHIVMYFYYMIAAMGPEYQKYIWWKKYLTTFQMFQFILIMTHQFQLLFIECNYPRSFMIWIGLHGVLFLGLFSDFYKTKYSSKDVKAKSRENTGACMPVLDDNESKLRQNGISTYATIYNKEYNSCYSNGTNNGYVANNNAEKKLA